MAGDPTGDEEFGAAFKEATEDPPEGEELKEPKPEEEEEVKSEPEEDEGDEPVVATPPSQEEAEEANRRSLLGRIEGSRRGLPKMEGAYRQRYGVLPGDKTSEERAEAEERKVAIAKVAEELPEVKEAIDDGVNRALDSFRDEMADSKVEDANAVHFAAIQEVHPDLAEFQATGTPEREFLNEWIDSHTFAERAGLNHILSNGSSAEIIELLDDFKEAVEALLVENPPEGESAGDPKVKAAAQRVIDAGAVPAGEGATLVSEPGIDENDFSGAFARAVQEDGRGS